MMCQCAVKPVLFVRLFPTIKSFVVNVGLLTRRVNIHIGGSIKHTLNSRIKCIFVLCAFSEKTAQNDEKEF